MFIVLLLMCVGTILGGNEPLFTYNQFDDADTKPPIYVQQMENIKVYAETWKVATRIDLSYCDKELEHVQSVIDNTTTLCDSLFKNYTDNSYLHSMYQLTSGCNSTLKELRRIIDEMKELNLTQFINNLTLFATLSRHEAVIYLKQFEKLQQSKDLSNKIVSNCTTLIEGSMDMFQNNQEKLKIQGEKLQKQVNDTTTLLKTFYRNIELKGTKIRHLLQDIISYATLLIIDYKMKQQLLIQSLTMGIVDRNHQTLLPPRVLLHELEEIENLIRPMKLQLPFDLQHESISLFYDVAMAKFTIINKQLIFVYQIPIVEDEHFLLYELYAYPRKMEGEMFQLMLPDLQYVAMDKKMKNYIARNERDLDRCYDNGNTTLLCRLTEPILSTQKSGSCAIHLLTNTKISSGCNYRITVLTSQLWIQLRKRNSWLLVFPKRQQVTIECNSEIQNRYMKGAGILTIQPKCSAKTEYVYIIASEQQHTEMYKQFEIEAEMTYNWKDIMDVKSWNEQENMASHLHPTMIDDNELAILEKISIDVKDVKRFEAQSMVGHHSKQLRDIEYEIYVIISAFIMAMLYKCLQHLKQNCFRRSSTNLTPNQVRFQPQFLETDESIIEIE